MLLHTYRYMEVSGFHGVIAGCLVAVKQLIPDTEVTLLRVIRFHAKVGLPAGPERRGLS